MRVFSVGVAILLLSVVLSSSSNAEILKWVDENGRTHYGDQPSGDKDYEFVGDSDLITYSKQSSKKMKYKKYRRVPSRNLSSSTGNSGNSSQQRQQYRTEGSSSSRPPARGSSRSRY